MTEQPQSIALEQEPIGLVISLGSQPDVTPRFCAYVWSDVPEIDENHQPARRAA